MDFANPAYFSSVGLDPAQVISFVGGWVGHQAPPALATAYTSICSDPASFHASGAYSPTLGTSECQQAIVDFERHLHGVTALTAEQVVVGASSTQLTAALLRVLLDPGDRVLLLDPTYCNLPAQLLTSLAVDIERFRVLDPHTWRYDERAEDIGPFILERRPKVVLLISPDNPTSQVLSDRFVEAALSACRSIGAFLVLDGAYKELSFAAPPPAYYAWGPDDNFVLVRSNSKWCRGLGRRLGWLLAPRFVVEALDAVQGATVLAPDTLHQMAFSRMVRTGIEDGTLRAYVARTCMAYRVAAQAVTEALAEHAQVPCLKPQGGLYVALPVGRDGAECVDGLLREQAVLCVPGWGFGASMSRAIRLSFGPLVEDLPRLREGIRRLGLFLA
jgi:aminotransferase